ncbi:MAG TPA: hypothetical protein VN635_01260 [Conexibacter sp.]|nr:hypothetical protein [Conexibacter sp.]
MSEATGQPRSRRDLEVLLALGEGRELTRRERARARRRGLLEVRDPWLEQQRGVVAALRSGGPAPAPGLAARVGGEPRPTPHAWTTRRALVPTAALAACTAAVALVVALASQGGGDGRLLAARVADVWQQPQVHARPPVDASDHARLRYRFAGVAFPNYHDAEGWHPGGTRTDTIDGRATATVFYVIGRRRAAYTVVRGTGLALPANAERVRAGRLHVVRFRDGDRWVIVFERNGSTCVLTAAAPREREWLLQLADWPV